MAKGALQKTKSKAKVTKPSRTKKTSKSDTESNEDSEESAEETDDESDNETRRSKRKKPSDYIAKKDRPENLKSDKKKIKKLSLDEAIEI